MGQKRTDEFRQDAVRIALTSGLTRVARSLDSHCPAGVVYNAERGKVISSLVPTTATSLLWWSASLGLQCWPKSRTRTA